MNDLVPISEGFEMVDADILHNPSRESILAFEEALKLMPPGIAPVDHVFAPGVYARCMNIPKGTMLTGKIHKTRHLNIVASGDISVATEDGLKRIKAPCIFVSEPNTKRAGHAHEDTVWITIHVTEETDLAKIEEEVITEDFIEGIES